MGGCTLTHGVAGVKHGCLRTIAVLLAALLSAAAPAPSTSGAAPRRPVLTLRVYDRRGVLLDASAARALFEPAGATSGQVMALVDPVTMVDVSDRPVEPVASGDGLRVTLPGDRPAALVFTWLTSPTRGWSQVEIDRGGSGWRTSATVNLMAQAALDSARRFDSAYELRRRSVPPLRPGNALLGARSTVHQLRAQMIAARNERERGRLAWPVLAATHEAFDLLLVTYGPQRAAVAGPWLGVTLDDATAPDAPRALTDLASMVAAAPTGTRGWVRIVFDPEADPEDYDAAVVAAHRRGLSVLGTPVDSSVLRSCSSARTSAVCTVEQHAALWRRYLTRFGGSDHTRRVDAWEVGNEANGEWVDTDPTTGTYTYGSGKAAAKVADAIALVRRLTTAPAVLTLYWQQATAPTPGASTFTWAARNIAGRSTFRGVDIVLLSAYPDDAPSGLGFDAVMSTLAATFPSARIGLGELGYRAADTSGRFWTLAPVDASSSAADVAAGQQLVARQLTAAAMSAPRSIGGGFWWYFQEDSAGSAGARLAEAIVGGLTGR